MTDINEASGEEGAKSERGEQGEIVTTILAELRNSRQVYLLGVEVISLYIENLLLDGEPHRRPPSSSSAPLSSHPPVSRYQDRVEKEEEEEEEEQLQKEEEEEILEYVLSVCAKIKRMILKEDARISQKLGANSGGL